MNTVTHSQTIDETKSLVKEFKKAINTSCLNRFKILSLSAKIDYAAPLQDAKNATMEELKYKGTLILLGSQDPSSILNSVPYDIFSFIFNINVEVHQNAYQRLLKFNEKHKDDVLILKTGRGIESRERGMRRSNYYLGK